MTTNLEVYFCDICNQSVPGVDLDAGRAVRVRDRVVGSCCVARLGASETKEPNPAPQRVGASAWVAVPLLLAIGGATAFLDYRGAEEVGSLRRSLDGVDSRLAGALTQVEALRSQVAATAGKSLDPVRLDERFQALEAGVASTAAKLDQRTTQLQTAIADDSLKVLERVVGFREEQLAIKALLQTLSNDVAALRASPSAPPAPAEAVGASPPVVNAPGDASKPDLPAELKHSIAELADAEAGTRFAAVEKLLRSRDTRVLSSLLPMAKDANLFVRRLTVEGLKDFRCAESVDTLLVALGDSEPLVRFHAAQSLRGITSQRLEFDPDANPSARTAAQRRWQEWWEKNRAAFTF